jgi:ketopantoate reductase
MTSEKANVLILGGGAVGAIAAVNLEVGGLAEVTAVLRSNFTAVQENGYIIESVDHGKLTGWRPTKGIKQEKTSLWAREGKTNTGCHLLMGS